MSARIDLVQAQHASPAHYAAIEAMKDQLIIVLLKRLGGTQDIGTAEIDDTGQDLLMMSLDPDTRVYHFEVAKKS